MSDNELILIMQKNGFSKKQIEILKKLSVRYSTSLHETVAELARRFPRSVFTHLYVLSIVLFTWSYSKEVYLNLGIFVFCLIVIDFFAPLFQGYKARKTIKEIQKSNKFQ